MCCVYILHLLQIRENELVKAGRSWCFFIKYFLCSGERDDSSWIILLKLLHAELNHQSVEVFSSSVNSWPKWTWPTGCWAETLSRSALKCSTPQLPRPSGQWRGFPREHSCAGAPGESRDMWNTAGNILVQLKQVFQAYSTAKVDGSDRCSACVDWYLCVHLSDICKGLLPNMFLLAPYISAWVLKKQF